MSIHDDLEENSLINSSIRIVDNQSNRSSPKSEGIQEQNKTNLPKNIGNEEKVEAKPKLRFGMKNSLLVRLLILSS